METEDCSCYFVDWWDIAPRHSRFVGMTVGRYIASFRFRNDNPHCFRRNTDRHICFGGSSFGEIRPE